MSICEHAPMVSQSCDKKNYARAAHSAHLERPNVNDDGLDIIGGLRFVYQDVATLRLDPLDFLLEVMQGACEALVDYWYIEL